MRIKRIFYCLFLMFAIFSKNILSQEEKSKVILPSVREAAKLKLEVTKVKSKELKLEHLKSENIYRGTIPGISDGLVYVSESLDQFPSLTTKNGMRVINNLVRKNRKTKEGSLEESVNSDELVYTHKKGENGTLEVDIKGKENLKEVYIYVLDDKTFATKGVYRGNVQEMVIIEVTIPGVSGSININKNGARQVMRRIINQELNSGGNSSVASQVFLYEKNIGVARLDDYNGNIGEDIQGSNITGTIPKTIVIGRFQLDGAATTTKFEKTITNGLETKDVLYKNKESPPVYTPDITKAEDPLSFTAGQFDVVGNSEAKIWINSKWYIQTIPGILSDSLSFELLYWNGKEINETFGIKYKLTSQVTILSITTETVTTITDNMTLNMESILSERDGTLTISQAGITEIGTKLKSDQGALIYPVDSGNSVNEGEGSGSSVPGSFVEGDGFNTLDYTGANAWGGARLSKIEITRANNGAPVQSTGFTLEGSGKIEFESGVLSLGDGTLIKIISNGTGKLKFNVSKWSGAEIDETLTIKYIARFLKNTNEVTFHEDTIRIKIAPETKYYSGIMNIDSLGATQIKYYMIGSGAGDYINLYPRNNQQVYAERYRQGNLSSLAEIIGAENSANFPKMSLNLSNLGVTKLGNHNVTITVKHADSEMSSVHNYNGISLTDKLDFNAANFDFNGLDGGNYKIIVSGMNVEGAIGNIDNNIFFRLNNWKGEGFGETFIITYEIQDGSEWNVLREDTVTLNMSEALDIFTIEAEDLDFGKINKAILPSNTEITKKSNIKVIGPVVGLTNPLFELEVKGEGEDLINGVYTNITKDEDNEKILVKNLNLIKKNGFLSKIETGEENYELSGTLHYTNENVGIYTGTVIVEYYLNIPPIF